MTPESIPGRLVPESVRELLQLQLGSAHEPEEHEHEQPGALREAA
jgi:hypothetical protein